MIGHQKKHTLASFLVVDQLLRRILSIREVSQWLSIAATTLIKVANTYYSSINAVHDRVSLHGCAKLRIRAILLILKPV